MKLQQIERTKVGEQVLNQLQALIENGTWEEGQKIPSERELSISFGVSHTTVRQALQRLNALGLLETRVGEGSFVKALTPQNCLDVLKPDTKLNQKAWQDVFEFREMLEDYAVQLAAERATEEDLDLLEKNYTNMEKTNDPEHYALLDAQFHTAIGNMTQNDMIIRSYEILESILKRAIMDEIEHVGIRGAEYHRKMIDALKKRDAVTARDLMHAHLLRLSRATKKIDDTQD